MTKNIEERFHQLHAQIGTEIVGQEALIERLFIALLCGGHLLVEGVPGLAKTKAIQSLEHGVCASFQRIQFTPDLLPGDITGTEIYRQQTSEFVFQPGPVFNNLILADEINRAPAKVQSAMLEAMAEGQVSVGKTTYKMPSLFLVMATQNPIEQEGTYPLPEAQLDRFMLHVRVNYPSVAEERYILDLVENEHLLKAQHKEKEKMEHPLTNEEIFEARRKVFSMFVPDPVKNYIVQLIDATRNAGNYSNDLGKWIEHGASPRATIAIAQAARARAWLKGKEVVDPQDVQDVAPDALRHRLLLTIEAEANGVTPDKVIDMLLDSVPAI